MPSTPAGAGKVSIIDSYPAHPPYFIDLLDLENYVRAPPEPIPPPGDPLRPRANRDTAGKAVVCHDMMGGYPNDAHDPMFTMEWWAMTDVFIYFSHHRVGPPPREWINAGHRQGCRVLGTLILEGSAVEDRYKILTGASGASVDPNSLSNKYADYLIDLCEIRGFDGYLLNFEIEYQNATNARLLCAWVAYIRSESRRRLGPDRSVMMWYDSVTVDGSLWWQNTLNHRNSAFFLASDSFFTNYVYRATTIPAAQKFLQDLVGTSRPTSEIAFGIDMWGRNTYQGGGYRACLALDDIQPGHSPKQHGFSAAIFAPAYLWENDTLQPHDRAGWWARDSLLWVGRSTKEQTQRDLKKLNTDPQKQFGPSDTYEPFKSYFPFQPQTLPFSTNFSLGAGTFFNVQGEKVTVDFAWADHDFVAPLPDLAMPCSMATPLNGGEPIMVEYEYLTDQRMAWYAGNSLQLSCPSYKPENGVLFVPLFSVDLASGPEHGCVIMFEITWMLGPNDSPSSIKDTSVVGVLAMQCQMGATSRSAPIYVETSATVNKKWVKTMGFFQGVKDVVHFGAAINFVKSPASPANLGAASIRAVSGIKRDQQKFVPDIVQVGCSGLDFAFSQIGINCSGTLSWQAGLLLPAGPQRPTSNPAWPTIPQTSLNADNTTFEVTTWLIDSVGKHTMLAWGTTSTRRQTISWLDGKVQELINNAENPFGIGHVELRVQAIDGAGYRQSTPATLKISIRDRKILH